jgi:hypothetical protein
LTFIGVALALYVFMADTLRAADQGMDAIRNVLPARFNWPLFCAALTLMSAPVLQTGRWILRRQPAKVEIAEGTVECVCTRNLGT